MTSSSSSSIQQPISEDAVQNLVQTLSYVSTKHQHVSATATQEIGIAMPHDSDMDLVLTSFSEQLVYEQIRSRLDICFHRKLSSSMMLFGDNEDARALLHRALHALSHDHETFRRVAIVKGQHTHSDAEGLLSISNQLLLRRQTDKELNAALEDLEQYFTQCRMDGIPAILIIEDFHVFAMRKRQMMIYTLLDFMHKRDLLFMVSIALILELPFVFVVLFDLLLVTCLHMSTDGGYLPSSGCLCTS